MNKLTKGTVAAGAALLLLLGTGGTLAYWNDSANLDGASISAGNLQLEQADAAWTIQHTTGAITEVADIADVRIVPGDKLIYTGDYEITASGDNLVVNAAITAGSITAAQDGDAAANAALAGRLAQTAAYTVNGVAGATGLIEHRDPATGTYDVQIAVTLTWPFGAAGSEAADNPAMLGEVDLSAFTVSVTQVDGSTNP